MSKLFESVDAAFDLNSHLLNEDFFDGSVRATACQNDIWDLVDNHTYGSTMVQGICNEYGISKEEVEAEIKRYKEQQGSMQESVQSLTEVSDGDKAYLTYLVDKINSLYRDEGFNAGVSEGKIHVHFNNVELFDVKSFCEWLAKYSSQFEDDNPDVSFSYTGDFKVSSDSQGLILIPEGLGESACMRTNKIKENKKVFEGTFIHDDIEKDIENDIVGVYDCDTIDGIIAYLKRRNEETRQMLRDENEEDLEESKDADGKILDYVIVNPDTFEIFCSDDLEDDCGGSSVQCIDKEDFDKELNDVKAGYDANGISNCGKRKMVYIETDDINDKIEELVEELVDSLTEGVDSSDYAFDVTFDDNGGGDKIAFGKLSSGDYFTVYDEVVNLYNSNQRVIWDKNWKEEISDEEYDKLSQEQFKGALDNAKSKEVIKSIDPDGSKGVNFSFLDESLTEARVGNPVFQLLKKIVGSFGTKQEALQKINVALGKQADPIKVSYGAESADEFVEKIFNALSIDDKSYGKQRLEDFIADAGI